MVITRSLNTTNRLVVCLIIIFGRLAPFTVIGVVNRNWMKKQKKVLNI